MRAPRYRHARAFVRFTLVNVACRDVAPLSLEVHPSRVGGVEGAMRSVLLEAIVEVLQ